VGAEYIDALIAGPRRCLCNELQACCCCERVNAANALERWDAPPFVALRLCAGWYGRADLSHTRYRPSATTRTTCC